MGFLYRLLTFPEIADTALFEKFITFEAGIMDEKELIRRLKDGGDGSEAGFRELYELYSPALYRFVYSYVKSADTAREITHEALVGLWLHRGNLDERRTVRGYLFTSCRNSLIKELRRQLRNPNIHDWVELSGAVSVESRISYDYDAYLQGIGAAKETLTPRQRQIFTMSREDGLSVREIAAGLGIGEQVVRNQLSTAMKKIREYLLRYMPLIVIIYKVLSECMPM